jgi:hypothetical protein
VTGVFKKWQSLYAEKGIATFPVNDNKKPCTKGYDKIGLNGSAELAEKFSEANAFGFMAGRRSGVTVLDVDIHDDIVLADSQLRHGKSPFIVMTGNGYHAWYRHGGERRQIRPDPNTPIDILGGGLVIAPPSQVAKAEYQIIQGTLDDLGCLPPIHAALDGLRSDNAPIPEGKRDNSLFRFGLEQAQHVDDFESLLDAMRTRNMDCRPPLADDVVVAKAMSAWRYEQEGRNLVGRGRAVVLSHSTIDRVMAYSPDAFVLLTMLKRHHWGRDFVLAKPMAASMGWTLRRWKSARNLLVRLGLIACIHEGGMGPK